MSDRHVTVRDHPTPDEIDAILGVVEAATVHDGVRPLGESALLRLRDGEGALVLHDAGELVGVAHLADGVGELGVHPDRRGRGHGRALAEALLDASPGELRVWAHGELPAAVALAGSLGFERFRALWTMRRPSADPLPAFAPPEGVRLRTFEVGRDEDAWVAVNARAFADHPEQGGRTRADLQRLEREPWFDPAGFFVAERAGRMVGFHWTKVHPGDPPLGEVYVVGVAPEEQGTGLGKVLTLAGLEHLRERGLPWVMLYTEETNTPAIGLYESLGFAHRGTDAMYRH